MAGFSLSLEAVSPTPPAGGNIELGATAWMSPGRTFVRESEFRFLALVDYEELPQDLSQLYLAKFGAPGAGQLIYFRARIVTQKGFVSDWRRFLVVVG